MPLELTHAALACVVADHHRDRVVGHRDVLVAEAGLLELTRNQITLCDFCFLGFGISGEIDHFHPIEQGSRNVLDEIRRADEQHLAQIERHAQVMIGEVVVLSRIQYLEERARRIALERHTELVNLVEQEDGILRPGLLHSLDDASWHRPHIRAPVATNVGLVASATEGDTHVLPA